MNAIEVATASGPPWSNSRTVLWLIDGRDIREAIADAERQRKVKNAGNYWGPRRDAYFDPIQMALGVRADPLVLFEEGEEHPPYVWLAVCSCFEDGCASVIADLILDEETVTWDDVRVVTVADQPPTGHLGLSYTFDAREYRKALASHRQLVFDPRPART